MKKLIADDPETRSPDVQAENLAALRALFPEVITEGPDGVAVNLDVLKQLVGDRTVTDAEEKYGLNWHGKRRARQLALTPSTGTLRPCPDESVDWDTTQNLMIEGDNLEVLKLLQKSYAGKVKLIYIDPPYNTGKDFVYPDDFRDNIRNYETLMGWRDEDGNRVSTLASLRNSEASGRFHTDWLNMMYPRLRLARNLLRDDGCLFISIDGHEVDNLRKICNEVFGEENLVCSFVWEKRYSPPPDTTDVGYVHEDILFYRKSDRYRMGLLPFTAEQIARYKNPGKDPDPRGPWKAMDYTCRYTADERPNLYYPITHPSTGKPVWPKKTRVWAFSPEVHAQNERESRIWWGINATASTPALKNFLTDVQQGMMPMTLLHHDVVGSTDAATKELRELLPELKYTPKPVRLLQHLALIGGLQESDVALDFFAGLGTTGHAVMAKNAVDASNCRYILVQLPEPLEPNLREHKASADLCDKLAKPRTLAELSKERLRRAGTKIRDDNPLFAGDLGFRVFKLASSNIRAWEPDRNKLPDSLFDSVDHLKPDRTEQDILFELLLKLGLDLCVPIETKQVPGSASQAHVIHSIGGGSLLVCLSPAIPQADVEPLALGLVAWHQSLQPAGETTVVFRDSAFGDDVAKTNLTAILQQHGLKTVRSL